MPSDYDGMTLCHPWDTLQFEISIPQRLHNRTPPPAVRWSRERLALGLLPNGHLAPVARAENSDLL